MRPTERPAQPYTRREIAKRIRQHFMVEGNPVCSDDNGSCFYGRTGCAIGCMMTMEDADKLGSTYRSEVGLCPEIMRTYFRPEDDGFLSQLQREHDGCAIGNNRLHIKKSLEAFLQKNGL